jgi:hypothetical protein
VQLAVGGDDPGVVELAQALINVTPSGAPISQLPLALIPTAAVPLLLTLHITSVPALRRTHRAPQPATGPRTADTTRHAATAGSPASHAR